AHKSEPGLLHRRTLGQIIEIPEGQVSVSHGKSRAACRQAFVCFMSAAGGAPIVLRMCRSWTGYKLPQRTAELPCRPDCRPSVVLMSIRNCVRSVCTRCKFFVIKATMVFERMALRRSVWTTRAGRTFAPLLSLNG